MPEYYVVLIAEKGSNSYHFSERREDAERIFNDARQKNQSATVITFGKLTVIDEDRRQ
jgi:hypothetical protein